MPNLSHGEYLLDIVVTNFTPLDVLKSNRKRIDLNIKSIRTYIAVESELGGTGGTSAFGVQNNVIEDYLKLLLINAKHKIMIFTSLPFSNEENHLANRVDNLREIYQMVNNNAQEILLIHLPGTQPRSNQVQATIYSLSGFIILKGGKNVREIEN